MRWLAAAIVLLLATWAAAQPYVAEVQNALYFTGPSNTQGAGDGAWPGDNELDANVYWFRLTWGHYHILKLLGLPSWQLALDEKQALSGTTICAMNYPHCCKESGSVWREWYCPSGPGATGDAECDAASGNPGAYFCDRSTIFFEESPTNPPGNTGPYWGLNQTPANFVIFEPGGNDCDGQNPAIPAAETQARTRDLMRNFQRYHRVRGGLLYKPIGLLKRNLAEYGGFANCANMWDDDCAGQDGAVGDDCTSTLESLVAEPEFAGRWVIDKEFYNVGKGTLAPRFYPGSVPSDRYREWWLEDFIHPNNWGYRLVAAYQLDHLGLLRDRPPPTPQLSLGTPGETTVDVGFSAVVSDPDGDVLTCVVWAVEDGQILGNYQAADRLHNGRGFCEQAGGNDCGECGQQGGNVADCNANGVSTDANADFWLTQPGYIETPDYLAGTSAAPDYFEVPGCGTDTVQVYGLRTETTYRMAAGAMPTLSRDGSGLGILPSLLDEVVFTTAAPPPGPDDTYCTTGDGSAADFCRDFEDSVSSDCLAAPTSADDVRIDNVTPDCQVASGCPYGDQCAHVATSTGGTRHVRWNLAGTECAGTSDSTCELRGLLNTANWTATGSTWNVAAILSASNQPMLSINCDTISTDSYRCRGALYESPGAGAVTSGFMPVQGQSPVRFCLHHNPNDSTGDAQKLRIRIDPHRGTWCAGTLLDETLTRATPAVPWGVLELNVTSLRGQDYLFDNLSVNGSPL